ncbi:NAD(P)H-dependent oxidoreductase [Conservatibacter flavescens]|uniref:NAD(P)H-dependent oxidoreductase n=1 Tax=Conservatibacter flavescens TaxID=28161 RepID=A0A2M8RZF2_9PAST|nr:NAD(P)H-dependent oxidoreductase [Conservatibacter flavescens]PJG84267.1 NAD(P)H-dependent oxidoreductase [Conservatibacter flavescens]
MSAITKEQVLEAFRFRAATRAYDPTKKISEEDFAYILECGRLSPSSVGSEPWKFVVIQNMALRKKLIPVSWGMATHAEDASHLMVILAKKNARYDSDFFRIALEKRGLNSEQMAKVIDIYKKFQTEDIKILENDRALFDWACKQTYIALGNMMTSAALIGIDSCPVEGFDYDAVNQILVENKIFDPTEWGVSVMVTFGYRAKEIRPKSRKEIEEVVQWVREE